MAHKKFLRIKTIKDTQILFKATCEQICEQDELSIRRDLLGIGGSIKECMATHVTIEDIFKVIDYYDISFSLELNYVDTREDVKPKEMPLPIIPPLCDLHKEMVEQRNKINNPDLKDIDNGIPKIFEDDVKKKSGIDPSMIPSFGVT